LKNRPFPAISRIKKVKKSNFPNPPANLFLFIDIKATIVYYPFVSFLPNELNRRVFSTNTRGGIFMAAVKCPVCDADVSVTADVMVGELMTCSDCGVELEVTALEPLTVEEAPEVQEDWGE
jgi:alpha-aminoadipate carrier protein LysW